ncbi:MAG: DUF481 domain-containing protein [Gammaproteobacteria bacterium]|nr:DUF481 domain-containing protein [Gammaproteobacteria bacterium]
MRLRPLAVLALIALSCPAVAQDPDFGESREPVWNATGELGFAMTRGNRRSENLNTRLHLVQEDARSKHQLTVSALRAKADVTVVGDDGTSQTVYQTSANRYQIGGSTSIKVDATHNWFGAARYERDDYAVNDYQGTFSFGYGHHFFNDDDTFLLLEVGPGYRRAREAQTQEVNSDYIVRSLLDFGRNLTPNTRLSNTLLVEAGDDNTFAQNDLGLTVAMSDALALKAGLQFRHNTEVDTAAGRKNTDTLSTVNLVYTFR